MMDEAIAMINKPMNLGVSSRGFFGDLPKASFDTPSFDTTFNFGTCAKPVSSFAEAEEITAQIKTTKIAVDYSNYNDYVNYSHDDLIAASPAMDNMSFIAANPIPHDTVRISGENGAIEVSIGGTLNITGDITMTEAAKTFWDSIAYYAPENRDTINKLEAEVAELKAKLSDSDSETEKTPEKSLLDRVSPGRMMMYIKNNLTRITNDFVFEPNDSTTRVQLKYNVKNFLHSIVERKGIHDFTVVCDETNNSSKSIDKGQLHIDVAVKPNRAAEFVYIPVVLKPTPIDLGKEKCENQTEFDVHNLAPPTNATDMVTRGYDPHSITEDFIFPAQSSGRGSRVETLPGGQNLGMLDDLEYFQRKVAEGLSLPKSYFMDKAQLRYDLIKAQLETRPSMIVDADSDIGKKFVQELRANKFDDSMELLK